MQDANDAMLAGWDLDNILASAAPIPNEDIASFGDLRSEVRTELFSSDTQRRGVQVRDTSYFIKMDERITHPVTLIHTTFRLE